VAAASLVPWHPPLVLVGHGIEVWNGIRSLRRLTMRSVNKVLCVSRYTKERMEQQAPFLARERFMVFHNALSEEWAAKATELAAASATVGRSSALDAESSKNFILSVTRLDKGDRYKGIVTVLEAFAMLHDRSLRYVVVGEGNDLPFLKSVATRCGVADRVDFLGTLSDTDLVGLYRGCRAFVLPSGKEGFGIVFLEAMFFNAPVIAAHEKGARDVVTDGETGLTIAYGDVVGLRDALERLLADESLANRLRSNGLQCVTGSGPFTFDQFTRRCAHALSLGSAS
jgi:glycosyltransferase involved in cell wall biosynthesis